MKKTHLLLLSILSGILLSAGWPVNGVPIFLFIGFVPLMIMEDEIFKGRLSKSRFGRYSALFYSYPAFFVWNILTTYWIYNSTFIGAAMAIFLNSLFMSIVFSLFHASRKAFNGRFAGYIALVAFWISFEYIHQRWEISWPWLNLGNGFANYTQWIQWYEFTGIFGGTLWVLAANIAIFFLIKQLRQNTRFTSSKVVFVISILCWINIPIILSKVLYLKYNEKENPVNVVVVQPNLDPYYEQYELSPTQVMDRIFNLAIQKADSTTDLVICPESAIQERPMYESEIKLSQSYNLLTGWMQGFKDLHFIIGASTYKMYHTNVRPTPTARKFPDVDKYYDAYNTAIMLQPDGNFQLYHKSKLTPGVEIMPYAKYIPFIENLAIDLGGTVGSLGIDKERTPFSIPEKNLKIAPVICYESAYGEFCARYIRNGAQLITVITNDGWWGETPGYKQHFSFSPLRAIETRRSVARSANTGISAFIDQRGDVIQATPYWTQEVIQQNINVNEEITFYVKNGDYIARISIFLAALLLLITISTNFLRKRKSLEV